MTRNLLPLKDPHEPDKPAPKAKWENPSMAIDKESRKISKGIF